MNKSIHILVVDDNDDLRTLMCNWLLRAGFAVHAARDAGEALELCATHAAFDLTVSDFNMPHHSEWIYFAPCVPGTSLAPSFWSRPTR